MLLYIPKRIEPGKLHCARLVGEGLAGRTIYYQIADERGQVVQSSKTCGVAGGANVYINVPRPGKYVFTVLVGEKCDYTSWPGMYEIELQTTFPFVATPVLYICVNRTWGFDCDYKTADFVSVVKPGVRIPIALDPVKRVSGSVLSIGVLATVNLYRDGQIVASSAGKFPFAIDLDTQCEMDLPQIAVPIMDLSSLFGTASFFFRLGLYVYVSAVLLNTRIPPMPAFMRAVSVLMLDQIISDLIPTSLPFRF